MSSSSSSSGCYEPIRLPSITWGCLPCSITDDATIPYILDNYSLNSSDYGLSWSANRTTVPQDTLVMDWDTGEISYKAEGSCTPIEGGCLTDPDNEDTYTFVSWLETASTNAGVRDWGLTAKCEDPTTALTPETMGAGQVANGDKMFVNAGAFGRYPGKIKSGGGGGGSGPANSFLVKVAIIPTSNTGETIAKKATGVTNAGSVRWGANCKVVLLAL